MNVTTRDTGVAPIQTSSAGVVVACGLVVSGLGQYAALTIAARALGNSLDSVFAAFWSLLAVAGPGLLAPLEQALARAVAARRALSLGTRPLLTRSAILGGGAVLVFTVIAAALVGPASHALFRGDWVPMIAFIGGLATYAGYFLVRGVTAGTGRFGQYASLLGIEGILRVAFVAALALTGTRSPAAFAFAVVLGSLGATLIVGLGIPKLAPPGPPAAWTELSRALIYLAVGSLVLQFLASIGPVAVQVLATSAEQTAAARFLSSRIIAFAPLFLFPAVVAPLLPSLSAYAAKTDFSSFRRVWLKHAGFAACLGMLTVVGAALLGPWASRLLFGAGYDLTSGDFALLGIAATGLMLGQVCAAALVATRGFAASAVAWVLGAVGFFLVAGTVHSLYLRVETALVAGAWISAVTMAGFALARTAQHGAVPAAHGSTADASISALR